MLHTILLVYTICMAENPGVCKEVTSQYYSEHLPTPYQCSANGQLALAELMKSHPGWVIQRFKCIEEKNKEENI